jgi:hypothetical protein
MNSNHILYCEVRKNNKQLTPGHWFFHTGQWAICAEANKSKNGKWDISIHFAPNGQSIPKMKTFATLRAAMEFIAVYFGKQVIRGELPQEGDL